MMKKLSNKKIMKMLNAHKHFHNRLSLLPGGLPDSFIRNFSCLDFSDFKFENLSIDYKRCLINTDFSRSDLSNQNLTGFYFDHIDFSNANLQNTILRPVNNTMNSVNFENINFTNQDIEGLFFYNVNFRNVIFENTNTAYASFVGCDFSYANLQDHDFSTCHLSNCKFENANLKNSDFANHDLSLLEISHELIYAKNLSTRNFKKEQFPYLALNKEWLKDYILNQ